jgi:hypothetical protein
VERADDRGNWGKLEEGFVSSWLGVGPILSVLGGGETTGWVFSDVGVNLSRPLKEYFWAEAGEPFLSPPNFGFSQDSAHSGERL